MPERGASRKPQIAGRAVHSRIVSPVLQIKRGLRAFCATSSRNIDPKAFRAPSFYCVGGRLQ
jgi:hypothetical protein